MLNFDDLEGLSKRERQVLGFAANGLTDPQISERLHIGSETVKTFWISLRRKLMAKTRAHAVALAAGQIMESHPLNSNNPEGQLLSEALAYFIARTDGQILSANIEFFDELSLRQDELYEINIFDITSPEFAESDYFAMQQFENSGVITPYFKELIRRDGSRVPIIVAGRKYSAIDDAMLGYFMPIPATIRKAIRQLDLSPQEAVIRHD